MESGATDFGDTTHGKAVSFRPAQPSDAATLGAAIAAGFAEFRAFAPHGWKPPTAARETELLEGLLGWSAYWCLVATVEGRAVGHIAFLPAAAAYLPSDEPGLAHLRQLFVTPERWGTGLASTLHKAALREAASRGFERFRLFTATGQVRARRFYEREGWTSTGAPFDAAIGLEAIAYRRATRV